MLSLVASITPALATSSTSITLPKRLVLANWSTVSSLPSHHRVIMVLGAIALTLTLGARPTASALVRWMMPALEMPYGMLLPLGVTPEVEATFRIDPLASPIRRAAARQTR